LFSSAAENRISSLVLENSRHKTQIMARYLFVKYFAVVLFGGLIVAGASLIVWAQELSIGYNAWTARLRLRYPQIFRLPTPEVQARNIEIMAWLYRGVGVALALESIFALIGIWNVR
jgi:hypothetical protein